MKMFLFNLNKDQNGVIVHQLKLWKIEKLDSMQKPLFLFQIILYCFNMLEKLLVQDNR